MKMHKHVRQIITFAAALAVSSLAISMAISSAMQRATTDHDRVLLASLSVVIVMAVHLLPTLLRVRHPLVLWPVWVLCLALAGFGHASWFYRAAESAAEARQAGSAAALAVAQQRLAIEQALGTIKARPVAAVAAQLARTTDPDRREVLALELSEARRAAGLRDRLVSVAGYTSDTPRTRSTTGEYVGSTQSEAGGRIDIQLVMSVVAALLIEVLGALLWSAALSGDDDDEEATQPVREPAPTVVQQVVNALVPIMSGPGHDSGASGGVVVVDELADLRSAIARGECRSSVRGVMQYMGCGQKTASRLIRSLSTTD
ncbi:MAG: hypothetical protein CK604_07175 [Curvibacter sp. PD_MW3]|nr:MAG: hypothetical protein CK604_07175 [Curvibacter sp. PD_MW3]